MASPSGQTVYHYFRAWRDDGTLQKLNQQLYQWERTAGHDRDRPLLVARAVVDSQSVDTTTMISQDVGVDGNKKIKGRKRHVMVNSLGFLLVVVVTAANVTDSQGLRLLLEKLKSLNSTPERLYLIPNPALKTHLLSSQSINSKGKC